MPASLIEELAAAPMLGVDARSYAVAADGAIAFQWYHDGDWRIYLLDPEGREPRRIGDIPDACWCPTFSPDGRHLYFAKDDAGSECFDFCRYDVGSGTVENLLPDTPDFSPLPDASVSPDGTRLAFTASHEGGYSVAVMPAAASPRGEAMRHLSRHPSAAGSPRWSPDGRRLAVAAGTRGQDTAVYIIDAESGARSLIGGDDHFFAGQPAWSPDGRALAFAGGPGEHPGIGICDLATGAITWAWRGPLDAHDPAWAPDGGALVFLADCDAETGLFHLDLRGGAVTELSIGPGNHYQPGFTADGAAVLCVLSGPGEPPALYRVELADGDATRLTPGLPPNLGGHSFASGCPVRFTSLDHLAEVPALLVEPPEPCGAGVVLIHGGPTWHHANEWDPLRQAFIDAGVTVVHPNYRGSDGYGRRWQLANRWLIGQGEALDVAAAHRFLVSLGCDPERIGVTGRSHGGYLTMHMVTQFPGLWACAVAGVPFFDHIDAQQDPEVRDDLVWWDRQNVGDVVMDRARLEYYSPINHLDAIDAPLLLFGGERDPRCPPRQIRQVAGLLDARGATCDLVIYPDEGHEISRLEHRIDYDRRTVEFILRHLGVPFPG